MLRCVVLCNHYTFNHVHAVHTCSGACGVACKYEEWQISSELNCRNQAKYTLALALKVTKCRSVLYNAVCVRAIGTTPTKRVVEEISERRR